MNTCKQKHSLFHDGSSCHIETSPLICTANQSMNWFLYNKDLCHLHPPYTKSLFLHFVSHNSPFFLPGFLSGIFTIYRITHEGGGYLLISFLLLLPASQTLGHQLDYCCRELTSLHSWQPELNMDYLVHALQYLLFLLLHWQLLLLGDCLKLR